jgi:molybdopterin molybdotransferase
MPTNLAVGHTLAQDIIATRNQPPFNRVMMDGIAINSSSTNLEKKIQSTQAAGSEQQELLDINHCIEIMTGASLPINCDCVIPYENISIKDGVAYINSQDINPNNNIHHEGSDYLEGVTLLQKNIKISAPVIATIASQGLTNVLVNRKPRITIVSTGSELVEPGNDIEPHQIFSSNSFAIESELKLAGFNETKRVHIDDNKQKTKNVIQSALTNSDILIMTGGVSKGKFDFIPEIMDELNISKHFHRISQRPGKPMWFGTNENKAVFALPGNPVSCLVCLRRYVLPVLTKEFNSLFVQIDSDISFSKDLTYFPAVKLSQSREGLHIATPIKSNSSGDFHSLSLSDGFIELPKDRSEFKKGELYPFFSWSR